MFKAAFIWAPAPGVEVTPSVIYQNRERNDVSIYWPLYSNANNNSFVSANPSSRPEPSVRVARAGGESLDAMLAQSADGQYVYVQNATPATSVTVVDMRLGKVVGEIPVAGCFGIYPSAERHRFSSPCGDGTFASFTLAADGSSAERQQSAKIFDVDQDALFMPSARVATDLVFISFSGNVYRLSDSGPVIKLVDRYSVTKGVNGGWAPGGAQPIGYNKANRILFIGMHPKAYEGSHKDPAKEIWAVNLLTKKLLYRTAADDILSLTATDTPIPVVYASKSKLLMRYEADPKAKFALKKSHEAYNPGPYNIQSAYRP